MSVGGTLVVRRLPSTNYTQNSHDSTLKSMIVFFAIQSYLSSIGVEVVILKIVAEGNEGALRACARNSSSEESEGM